MRTIYCECCSTALNAPTEIATGLCSRHYKDLLRKDTFVGVCWECGRITIIDEIPKRLREVFRDKYVFVASCSKCSGILSNDIKWLTFERFNPAHSMSIDEKGTLVDPVDNHQKSKDRNPVRFNAETELHSSGSSTSWTVSGGLRLPLPLAKAASENNI